MGDSATSVRADVLDVDLGRGVRAAFTTRRGGVSSPPWSGLNLGLGVGDDPVHVRENRDRVGAWVGTPVVFATQVHGREVVVVDAVEADAEPAGAGECDALVTRRSDVALGILVADCVPVLLADAGAGVVAGVHAGRRGLMAGVVPSAVARMVEQGARVSEIRAVLGPYVCGACYEVPRDLHDEVVRAHPATHAVTRAGTPGLDLGAGVAGQLLGAGVALSRMDVCTMTDNRFYSHRRATRAGTATGRFAGVIRLLPTG